MCEINSVTVNMCPRKESIQVKMKLGCAVVNEELILRLESQQGLRKV